MIDIDLATLMVSAFFLMAFFAPFVIQKQKQNKLEKHQAISFLEFAEKMNLKLSKTEKWRNHYQIGLDEAAQKLIYIRFGDFPCQEFIDLKTIKSCSQDQKIRKVKIGKETHQVIDYLALTLHYINPDQPNKNLEFYDSDQFPDLIGEKVMLQNWTQLINQNIQ
ncbi:hypothetical protein SAMN04488104_103553 [Algoriphagus faecimaris]|uniref:Uncharacterized protein n=1 Tax=Algoriphagus faecimaris TaxID=686796 RepID=A0A1G6VIM5_9BACT|nr:hypothetical protein [Algoriphagus faecimaris]SDD53394.1 hypothetical protein SAMN04488104_103553 [Algoriphagus faecimaris]